MEELDVWEGEIIIDIYSLVSMRLNLTCNGESLATASGFLFRYRSKIWLISNWHVMSGRNIYNGQPRHYSGAIPNQLTTTVRRLNGGQTENGKISLPLIDKDEPTWRQHSSGQTVDIAAIEVKNLPADVFVINPTMEIGPYRPVNDLPFGVGTDAFIIGYPDIGKKVNEYPVWKRASVATEPTVPFDDEPSFLLDTLSSEGMSGSPVIIRATGAYTNSNGTLMAGNTLGIPMKSSMFVGVYSGRYLEKDPLAPQLGKIWTRNALVELIENGVPGSFQLRDREGKGA